MHIIDVYKVAQKCWDIRKLEIILNNIFFYKNLHYDFVNELLKNTDQSWNA